MAEQKMNFKETLKNYIDKGVEASKKGIKNAGAAINDFGDKSVLRIELNQLNGKLEKQYQEFGAAAYKVLTARNADKVDADNAQLKPLIDKIGETVKDIKKHEKMIKESDKNESEKKSKNSEKK